MDNLTPELTPTPQASSPVGGPPPPVKVGGGFINKLIWLVVILILVWLGFILWRGFGSDWFKQTSKLIPQTPTKITTPSPSPAPPDPYSGWKRVQILSSLSRQPVEYIIFRLPSEVADLTCDGKSCLSQGTYLPGGTRLTVAVRGEGQLLKDFRGALISDVNGKLFDTSRITIFGRSATEYKANFTGVTLGGYAFSEMHGVMLELTDKLSLEVNHFTPLYTAVNFASDDKLLFEKILPAIELNLLGGGEKGSVLISPNSSPSGSN